MIINRQNLDTLFTGYKGAFAKGFSGAPKAWDKVTMKITSTTAQETYAWLAQLPTMREWWGDRVIQNLATEAMVVVNRDFESTIGVPRNNIEDDNYGVFSPLIEEMGRTAGELPDQLVFSLLNMGFTKTCFDGQYFFDTDHITLDANGKPYSVANTDGGNGAPWFLLDTSRAIRPLIFQERRPPVIVSKDDPRDDNVFMRKEYIYGVDSRAAAAFGMWQLAWGSRQTLNAASYETARVAMQTLRGDAGRPLGIKPTLLVVSPTLEGTARSLLTSPTLANGETNKWFGTAELLVSPWVDWK